MPTEVCARCHKELRSPYDQIEVRKEFRQIANLRRLRTWRVSMICRSCADEEWEAHDHPYGPPPAQGALI